MDDDEIAVFVLIALAGCSSWAGEPGARRSWHDDVPDEEDNEDEENEDAWRQ
jgi:hypothetical protein